MAPTTTRRPTVGRIGAGTGRAIGLGLGLAAPLLTLLAWSCATGGAALVLAGVGHAPPLASLVVPGAVGAPDVDDATLAAALGTARRLDPWSPDLLLAEALRLERAAQRPGLAADAAAGLLARADAHYRAALARRPTWPFAAAALVRVGLKRGAAAADIDRDLAQAIANGRWEPGVQRSLVATAFTAWSMLGPAQQDRLLGVLIDALAVQPHWVLGQAVATGRWAVVAPVVAQLAVDDPALAALAAPYAAAAERAGGAR